MIATATPTIYGWLASWNTTTVPNGSYTLQSVASSGGLTGTSPGITITVNNPPPTTNVVLPSNGATLSGKQYLDAVASSGVTRVQYRDDRRKPERHRDRHGHPDHLRVAGELEYHHRAERAIHPAECRFLRRRGQRHERSHHHLGEQLRSA